MMEQRGLRLKVQAYHGPVIDVGGVPTRSSIEHVVDVGRADVVNDPYEKPARGRSLDDVLATFQRLWGCKVSYLEAPGHDRTFDVFEPSWADEHEARAVARTLAWAVLSYVCASHDRSTVAHS